MLRSRLLRLASSAPLRNRFISQGSRYRSYNKGRDQRLTRQFVGEDESFQSRPWVNYAIPSVAGLAIAGVSMSIKYNDEKRAIPKESEHNFKLKPVFITIDPLRDTPDQFQTYLKEFDSRIVGLTGPISAVRQMAQEYRVYYKKVDEEGQDYLIESSNNMYLLDPNMEIVKTFVVEYDALQLADAIIREVKKESK